MAGRIDDPTKPRTPLAGSELPVSRERIRVGTGGTPSVSPASRAQETGTHARDTAEPQISLRELNEHQQLRAVLGATKDVEAVNLPQNTRYVSITVPRTKLMQAKAEIQGLGALCSEDFTGSGKGENVTLTGFVPGLNNARFMGVKLNDAGIPARILVAGQEDASAICMRGNAVMPVCNFETEEPDAPLEGVVVEAVVGDHKRQEMRLQRPTDPSKVPSFTTGRFATSRESLQVARTETIERPQAGSCMCFMFPLDIFVGSKPGSEKMQRLVDELASYVESKQVCVRNYGKHVVFIFSADRSGASVVSSAERKVKALNDPRVLAFNGTVKHGIKGAFHIEGFPDAKLRSELGRQAPGTYLTDKANGMVTDKASRHSGLYRIKTNKAPNSHLNKVESCEPLPSYRIGGPDKFIGYGPQVKQLTQALLSPKVKVIVVRGDPGIGKSSIYAHVTGMLSIQSVPLALDPSNVGRPGNQQSITIATQIAAQVKRRQTMVKDASASEPLMQFAGKTEGEQSAYAQAESGGLGRDCTSALGVLGKAAVAFDDLHYVTEESDARQIRDIMDGCVHGANGKVTMLERPGEMRTPKVFNEWLDQIKKEYGEDAVAYIDLEGLPFDTDDSIAYEYVYHSLPVPMREGNRLGDWYKTLGKIARNSPFVMNYLVGELLSNPDNFVTMDGVIDVKPDALSKVSQLKSEKDLAQHYTEKLAQLSPKWGKFINCCAIMGGGRLSTQMLQTIAQFAGITGPEFKVMMEGLVKGRYIFASNGNGNEEGKPFVLADAYELPHATFSNMVVESMNAQSQFVFRKQLFDNLKGSRELPEDVKLHLAHGIASDAERAPAEGDPFWEDYARLGNAGLKAASVQSDQAYSLAGQFEKMKIQESILVGLQIPGHTPTQIDRLVLSSLMEKAKSAIAIGQFEEAKTATDMLEAVHEANPNLVKADDVAMLQFNRLYVEMMGEAANPSGGNLLDLVKEMEGLYSRYFVKGDIFKQAARLMQSSRNSTYPDYVKTELNTCEEYTRDQLTIGITSLVVEILELNGQKGVDNDKVESIIREPLGRVHPGDLYAVVSMIAMHMMARGSSMTVAQLDTIISGICASFSGSASSSPVQSETGELPSNKGMKATPREEVVSNLVEFRRDIGVVHPREKETADKVAVSALDPLRRAIVDMKLAYRKGRGSKMEEIYQKNQDGLSLTDAHHREANRGKPHSEVVEIKRMRERGKLEAAIKACQDRRNDDDAILHPGALTPAETTSLLEVLRNTEEMMALDAKFQGAFDRIGSLSLLDMHGVASAMLGRYDVAQKSFAELWRRAHLYGIHVLAYRGGKMEGDSGVEGAMVNVTKFPTEGKSGVVKPAGAIDVGQVVKALEGPYKTKCGITLNAIHQGKDNLEFRDLERHSQIVRGVGIVADSFRKELFERDGATPRNLKPKREAEIKASTAGAFKMAFESLIVIQSRFSQMANIDDIQYYLLDGGNVLEVASRLGVEIPPELANWGSANPYFSAKAAERGIKHYQGSSGRHIVDGVGGSSAGEVARKLRGAAAKQRMAAAAAPMSA